MSRLREIALGFDQLVNACLGGYCSESLSSRSWRLRATKPFCYSQPVIDAMFFWQPNHCEASYINQVARRNMPIDYQNPSPPAA